MSAGDTDLVAFLRTHSKAKTFDGYGKLLEVLVALDTDFAEWLTEGNVDVFLQAAKLEKDDCRLLVALITKEANVRRSAGASPWVCVFSCRPRCAHCGLSHECVLGHTVGWGAMGLALSRPNRTAERATLIDAPLQPAAVTVCMRLWCVVPLALVPSSLSAFGEMPAISRRRPTAGVRLSPVPSRQGSR